MPSKTTPARTPAAQAVAMLSMGMGDTPGELHLLPDGEFSPSDGRPMPWGTWKLNAASAQRVIAWAKARKNDFVIDYEHQTQQAETNGLPAPAAGWWKDMEYRPGKGLYAVGVRWTTQAAKWIEGKEYRFSSAVFHHDKTTGEVTRMECATLTNTPALDGLDDVQLAMLKAYFDKAETAPAPKGDPAILHSQDETMNPLLKALLEGLGLADNVTEAAATAAVAALKAQAAAADGLTAQLKAAKPGIPDPALFASVDVVNQLNTEISILKLDKTGREVDELLAGARAVGKVSPIVEPVWREIGLSDMARLKALIEKTPANPALAGATQTNGNAPTKSTSNELTADELAVCKATGLTVEQFKSGATAA